jgi:hypothetical protein
MARLPLRRKAAMRFVSALSAPAQHYYSQRTGFGLA